MNTIAPPDQTVHAAAHALSDAQAKPVGALGRLEELAAWVAACQGECPPRPLTDVRVVVFAGDHGVAASGVSAYPAEVTPAMVHGILAGGAGVNALARAVGASVTVYDFGVRVLEGVPEEVQRFRIGPARPIHLEDALTESELAAALDAGDTIAAEAIAEGAQLLITRASAWPPSALPTSPPRSASSAGPSAGESRSSSTA
jgi:nicotinate-nucleotide--dimethylbenzimidazole phosphoribosyltransferase